MSVIAIVTTLAAGYDSQKAQMIKHGFKVGDRIPVDDIYVGQSSTSIILEGYSGSFNSVFFEFEENGGELDIYGDRRFNPYISMYDDID